LDVFAEEDTLIRLSYEHAQKGPLSLAFLWPLSLAFLWPLSLAFLWPLSLAFLWPLSLAHLRLFILVLLDFYMF